MEVIAWLAAHIVNISGKSLRKGQNVTPKDLLDGKSRSDPIAQHEKMRLVKEKLSRRGMH